MQSMFYKGSDKRIDDVRLYMNEFKLVSKMRGTTEDKHEAFFIIQMTMEEDINKTVKTRNYDKVVELIVVYNNLFRTDVISKIMNR